MDAKQAFELLWTLIEQANGAGFFKKISDLDAVRTAYATIHGIVNDPPKKLTHEKSTSLDR